MIRQPNQLFQSQNQPNYIQGGGGGGGGGQPGPLGGMMKQMAGMGVKAALAGTPMAPLSGMLGGLFNEGGVVGYNKGGKAKAPWYAGLLGKNPNREKAKKGGWYTKKNDGGSIGHNPDTFINGQIASVHYPTPGPARNGPVGLNMGGAAQPHPQAMVRGPLNPQGYNEGGMAGGETPIKKVMDEQKLDQQAVAFERDQARKQETHDMAMKQKQAAFSEAQKMKKASATTTKKPKAPLSAGKK